MIQPFLGRVSTGYASVVATSYLSLLSSANALAVDLTTVETIMPFAGQIYNVTVIRGTAPGVGNTITWTLQKNNVDTAITFTFGATDLQQSSTTGLAVSFAAGDLLKWKITLTGTPGGGVTSFIGFLINTGDNNTAVFFNGGMSITSVTPGWIAPLGCQNRLTTAAINRTSLCAVPGTITGYSVYQGAAAGTTGVGQDWALYKNGVKQDGSAGTPDTRLTVSTTTLVGQASTTFSLPVAVGDLIYFQTDRNGSASSKSWSYGLTFVPTNPGEIPFSMSTATLGTGISTEYQGYQVFDSVALTSSAVTVGIPIALQLDNLYINLTAAPGGVKTRVFTAVKSTVDQALTSTITGAATTGNDTTHKIKYATNDTFTLKMGAPASSTVAAIAQIGMRMLAITPKGAGGGQSNNGKKGGGGGLNVINPGGASFIQIGNIGLDVGVTS